nr:hypothetical protein [Tanacetum cinerariifolium]
YSTSTISITKDFKAHFRGTPTHSSNLDDDFVDCLYQCFLDRYQYEETIDPKEARKVWVRRSTERCLVNVEFDWDGILESWMKVQCVRRSKVGA